MQAPEWFGACMDRLTKAYPSWPCSAGTVQAFWDVLADMPRDAVIRATIAYCAQEESWPIAAKLRRLAKEGADSDSLTASEAWEEMYGHRHAHTANPHWSSEAVERAARAVNWSDPSWLSEQLPTIRAQFERYYHAVEKRSERTGAFGESLVLLERSSMMKSAKELYGIAFLKSEADDRREEEIQALEERMVRQGRDDN